MNENNEQSKKGLQINIDPDKLEAKYSDAVFINHNPFGFTFDFAQHLPQMNMMKVINRLSISPQHAKALFNALGAQIKQYEKNFGNINLTAAMEEHNQKTPIGFNLEKK
ncbi:MAG: DUF3467 domain-containing protein [Patescibacteria group bacterium]